MNELTPLIFAVKGNALDDGPGIRSVVFFKGCPLSCLWCHNPEGQKRETEISFDAGVCIGCDACLAVCPEHALNRDNPFFIDRTTCSLCFCCQKVCPSGAIQQVGKVMTVDEIVSVVRRDKPFYDASGGGVTLSGGEPTLFMDFAQELLRNIKSEGMHTLLETCGLFALAEFDQKIYPWLDLIYFDIKLIDTEIHTRFCGVPNRIILENFRQLSQRMKHGGIPVIPRIPLIPGITDPDDNLRGIADFLKDCSNPRVQLLPYHPLWMEKRHALGITEYGDQYQELQGWVSHPILAGCKSILEQAGLMVL